MSRSDRQQRLAQLRLSIAALETRPALAERWRAGAGAGGDGPAFAAPLPGVLQEIWVDDARGTGAGLGFALGQARTLLGGKRRAVVYVQRAAEAQEAGLPYAAGLMAFGIGPEQMLIVRPDSAAELLWAVEEAVSCPAVAAVIADIAGAPRVLDFTAGRRLGLRAEAGGAAVLLLRQGREREASAAALRWRVEPAMSAGLAFDARAPGAARLRVTLEKGFSATRGGEAESFMVDWTDNGFEPITAPRRGTPLYGAQPAALGPRLSRAG